MCSPVSTNVLSLCIWLPHHTHHSFLCFRVEGHGSQWGVAHVKPPLNILFQTKEELLYREVFRTKPLCWCFHINLKAAGLFVATSTFPKLETTAPATLTHTRKYNGAVNRLSLSNYIQKQMHPSCGEYCATVCISRCFWAQHVICKGSLLGPKKCFSTFFSCSFKQSLLSPARKQPKGLFCVRSANASHLTISIQENDALFLIGVQHSTCILVYFLRGYFKIPVFQNFMLDKRAT